MTINDSAPRVLRNTNPHRRGRVQHVPAGSTVFQACDGPACPWPAFSALPRGTIDAIHARYDLRLYSLSEEAIDAVLSPHSGGRELFGGGYIKSNFEQMVDEIAYSLTMGRDDKRATVANLIGGLGLGAPAPETAARHFLKYRHDRFRKHAAPIFKAALSHDGAARFSRTAPRPHVVVSNSCIVRRDGSRPKWEAA